MNKETGKQVWTAPKLEQIAMVDTAVKGLDASEDTKSNMFMTATGMQS